MGIMALRRIASSLTTRTLATSAFRQGEAIALGGGISHDQRVTAWVDYFDHPECDMFYFRRGNDRVIGDDWIPPPEVWQSMLYSCRRNNCLPSAIRVVEQIKNRCKDNRE